MTVVQAGPKALHTDPQQLHVTSARLWATGSTHRIQLHFYILAVSRWTLKFKTYYNLQSLRKNEILRTSTSENGGDINFLNIQINQEIYCVYGLGDPTQ